MAILIKRTITTTDLNYLKSLFDSIDTPLISSVTVSGNYLYLTLDNTFTINFCRYNANWFDPITITYDGTTTSRVTEADVRGNGLRLTILYNNNIFYLQTQDVNNRRGLFYYEKFNGQDFYGYKGSGTSQGIAFYDISGLDLHDVATENIYTYGDVITQADALGHILYLDVSILFIGSIKAFVNSEFISCSTITADQILTFENKNYYSLGTHIIVPIDN